MTTRLSLVPSLEPSPGLTGDALARYDTALARTAWGLQHLHRIALTRGDAVGATAERYDLVGRVVQEPVRICGIRLTGNGLSGDGRDHGRELVDEVVAAAAGDGADLVLLFRPPGPLSYLAAGFDVVPMTDVEITVIESTRYGAPMTLVRSGEDRDLAAIAAMGQIRAAACRFHLDRDVDFVKHAVVRHRLAAGLGANGAAQIVFVIAEEGITAAAYVVIRVVGRTWSIEECGDRDPSGARVGAILQALIAREPSEPRPTIHAWLPPGFHPPQIKVVSAAPAAPRLLVRALSPRFASLRLSPADVLFWRSDLF